MQAFLKAFSIIFNIAIAIEQIPVLNFCILTQTQFILRIKSIVKAIPC